MLYFSDDSGYGLNTSGHSWSFAKSGDNLRFEVRPGDQWSADSSGVERAEAVFSNRLSFGQTYSIDYSFMVESGADNTSGWVNIGQLHGSADAGDYGSMAPVFAVQLMGEKMRIVSRSDPKAISTDRAEDQILYKDTADIVRGHWYDMKIDIKVDPFGNGDIDVYRDGAHIVDYHGAVGYNDAAGPYWREGVYRGAASEKLAVNFKNLEVSTVDTGSSTVNKVVNGTPSNDVLMGGAANEDFRPGTGDDSIYAAGGNDTVNGGSGGDTIDGGSGNDRLFGGTNNDKLIGGDGSDLLSGGDNNDKLSGGAGADTLAGGDASDTITGGTGADVFRFDDRWNDIDHLTDFTVGEDKIQLVASEFGLSSIENGLFVNGLGSTTAGKAALHYVQSTGTLYWDSTGGTTIDAKPIAVLDNHAKLSLGDFRLLTESGTVTGGSASASADVVASGAVQTIDGTLGSDVLTGRAGADHIRAINGDDSIHGGSGTDSINGGSGADTINGGTGDDLLVGETSADKLIGGDGGDTLIGGDNGDTLSGGAGHNVFRFDGRWYEPDHVTDFTVGADKVQLAKSAFGVSSMSDVAFADDLDPTASGKAALHYVESRGQLYWDANGGSTGDAQLIAVFDNHAHLTASSFELF